MKLNWQELRVQLRDPFRIARESSVQRRNVIVTLEQGAIAGLGEAAPSAYYGETADTVVETLERLAPRLEAIPPDPATMLEAMETCLEGQNAAKAGVDIALHDLLAKAKDLPLWRYLGLPASKPIATSFTIALDTTERMVARARDALARYSIIKVKAGLKEDMAAVLAISALGPARLRVDANGGWSVDEAVEKIKHLEKLNVEFVEQPIAAGNLAGLETLRSKTSLPIMLDEDVLGPADIPAVAGLAHGINVKLMKCGGIVKALSTIRAAREHGLGVMLGCMIETAVGITAAAHLTPLADFADLDGNLLLAWDPYQGVEVSRGHLVLPAEPGLGVRRREPRGDV